MAKIPNQNDVGAIVDAIVQNTAYANTVLDAVFNSISKIAKAKTADVKLNDIQNVESMVVSYRNMINSIINVLCQDDNGQARDLHELLGAIRDDNKSTDNKVVLKYKTIDAALQLPKVIDSMFGVFDTISEQNFGFKALITFRLNLWKISTIINSLFKTMIDVFKSIDVDTSMDKIMKLLVKQPDIIEQQINVQQNSEFSKSDTSKTITKQGQLGILDAFAKIFEVINTLNTLRVPNFIMLELRLLKMRIALTWIIDGIIGWAEKHIMDDKKHRALRAIENALIGKENRKGIREGGLQGIIQALVGIFALTNRMKIGVGSLIMVMLSLKMLGVIIDIIVKMHDKFSALADKTISDNVHAASKTMNSVAAIFKTVCLLGTLSIPFIVLAIPLMISIQFLRLIVIGIEKLSNTLNKCEFNDNDFDAFKNLIDSLLGIATKLMIFAAISPIVLASALSIAILLLAGFIPLILAIRAFSYIASKRSMLELKMNLSFFESMIKSLIDISLLIIAFVPVSVITIAAIVVGFLPMMLSLWMLSGVLNITFKLIGKLTLQTIPNVLSFGLSIGIILGTLTISALMIFIVAKIQQDLQDFGAWGKVALMILGMIALTTLTVLLGLGVASLSPIIVPAMLGFGQILAIFGMLVGIGVAINSLAKTNLEIGEIGKVNNGTITGGSGAKLKVQQIFEFVKFLRRQLRSEENDRLLGSNSSWRRDKRMFTHIDKIVKEIVDIADRLKYLQTIKIDKELLIGGKDKNGNPTTGAVGKIFNTVSLIEESLTNFNKDSGNGLTYRRSQIKSRKRMRRNKRVLNKVDRVINKIVDIAEDLISIKNFNITDKEYEKIILGITNIFNCIENVDNEIKLKNGAATVVKNNGIETIKDITTLREERKLARKNKRIIRQNNKSMTKIGSIMETLVGVINAVESIKTFEWNITEEELTKKVNTIFKSITAVNDAITTKNNENIKQSDIEKLQPLIDYITIFGDSTKTLAEVDSSKLNKNINSYVNFVDKVNTIDVTKLETTADMFKQMSRFSTSIKGDFDKLAESLAEKLLPVLEELKEVMGVLPEKIDVGFQNTSASIAATNAPATKENITAQVNREKPNASVEDVAIEVASRMNENAKSEANGIVAKLNELISLFKGYGEIARVQLTN